ncbi:hypothetical protein TWF718_010197 [Orbilia javanica]|uniref:Uncharacterized protein n=1 Tax=Orbilia javanica TaxID=47235 RepID=A0AAN8NP72_9PEZI
MTSTPPNPQTARCDEQGLNQPPPSQPSKSQAPVQEDHATVQYSRLSDVVWKEKYHLDPKMLNWSAWDDKPNQGPNPFTKSRSKHNPFYPKSRDEGLCDEQGLNQPPAPPSQPSESQASVQEDHATVQYSRPSGYIWEEKHHLDPKMLNWSAADDEPNQGPNPFTKYRRKRNPFYPKSRDEGLYNTAGLAMDPTKPKAVTFPMRIKGAIPTFGGTQFGALCPNKDGGWSRCNAVSGRGAVNLVDGDPAIDIFQDASIAPALVATGRLFDPQTGCAESGFWLEGGFFITALHFAPWTQPNKPTAEELGPFLRRERELYVSTELYVCCDESDAERVRVYLMRYSTESDHAIFRAFDASYQPHSFIRYDMVLENDTLSNEIDMSSYFVFAAGFNSDDTSSLSSYVEAYRAQFPGYFNDHGGTLSSEPNYDDLLLPHRKTVSFVSGIKHSGGLELLVSCSCWKGYSGAPIFGYDVASGRGPFVFGTIVGGRHDGFYNEGTMFPNNFVHWLREIHGGPLPSTGP